MPALDDTDLEILELLGEDARRPYSDIADEVGLSGPAVSDRVTRLQDAGVLEGFTVEIDRSQLQAGVPVMVRVEATGASPDPLVETVAEDDAVEHVFVTAGGDVWFTARTEGGAVHRWLDGLLADVDRLEYDVTLLDDVRWEPSRSGTDFALTCSECGNAVDSQGESTRVAGELHHFCCSSCRSRFADRYRRLEDGA